MPAADAPRTHLSDSQTGVVIVASLAVLFIARPRVMFRHRSCRARSNASILRASVPAAHNIHAGIATFIDENTARRTSRPFLSVLLPGRQYRI